MSERTRYTLSHTHSSSAVCEHCQRKRGSMYTIALTDGDLARGPVICADCIAFAVAVLAEVEESAANINRVEKSLRELCGPGSADAFRGFASGATLVLNAILLRATAATSPVVQAMEETVTGEEE